MNTHFVGDTAVLLGRSLKHVTRTVDTIITTAIMTVAIIMLLLVYVFGGAIEAHGRQRTMIGHGVRPAGNRRHATWTDRVPPHGIRACGPGPQRWARHA